MSKFLAFCLLIVPLAQGFSIAPEPSTTDIPGPDIILKGDRELEEEILTNFTQLASSGEFKMMPLAAPDENGTIGPLHVKVNTYIRDIQIKNEDADLYHWTVELTFRQQWNDERLAYDVTGNPAYDYIPLSPGNQKYLWKPDTFFSESVKGDFHFLTAPNAFIWVYPNGDVLYSLRITVTLRCHPENTTAPGGEGETSTTDANANTLTCPMRVTSYGYTTDKLVYEWDEDEPIQFKSSLYIPHYTLDKVTTEKGTGVTKVGEFSAITAKFHFNHA